VTTNFGADIDTVASAVVSIFDANLVEAGLTKAVDPPPPAIQSAWLPLAYVLTGEGIYDFVTGGSYRLVETRIYKVRVAVLATAHDTPSERETKARPVLQGCKNVLSRYPSLLLTQWVQKMELVRDSGITILPDWGGKWIGFELQISVVQNYRRCIADQE
jgi:hypothetical protein